MPVFRVEKNKSYTVMSNHHLRNKTLSLKAKGLLSQMLSLPEDWDYTLAGLASINRESKDAIRSAVQELEAAGYVVRRQTTDEHGKFSVNEYVIYETPQFEPQPEPPEEPKHMASETAPSASQPLSQPLLDDPLSENPTTENPMAGNPSPENPTQLNTKRSSTEELSTDVTNNPSYPIPSYPSDRRKDRRKRKEADEIDMDACRQELKEQLGLDILCEGRPCDREKMNEILELMVETLRSEQDSFRIAGNVYPAYLVKERFLTTKHFRDKRNHYVDRSQWHITENVHEPIIDRADFENVQRILENAPVRRPNGDGEIHPLSGLLFCKDCGAKMHIRIDYRNGGKRHVAFCSEYHKGKARNPKCNSPHIIDADLLMQTVADVLRKIAGYSISNRADFEALVKNSLSMQQTDKVKKQQKRIPQITARLEQIDKVLNKLYEDIALGRIEQDRYEQMSQKYSEEYYTLKAELAEIKEQLSAFENADGRAQKFVKLTERYAAFTELTPAILNEFISKILVHERDVKRAKYAVHRIEVYFNHIGRFENELTEQIELTEQECERMREEIEEAKREKSRAYHRAYYKEYRAKNLERLREYDRKKAREYRAKKKLQATT